jgi:hypothetical protein
MVNVKPIQRILRYVLASGKLKDEKPLSVIFIAPVECGKTSIIRRYCLKAGNVLYVTDATAHGIIKATNQLKDFSSGRRTHIVIPDLLACLSRKQTTVKTFIHFMNALIEEGIVNISTYANNIQEDIEANAGLITAIPHALFNDKRHQWGKVGFLSRALPVSYDYKVSTQVEILSYIQKQEHLKEKILKLNLPKKPELIKLPRKMAEKIQPYALILKKATSTYQKVYGFRYQRQLQALAKAIALVKGKKEVDRECIRELGKLSNFINLDSNRI